MQANTPYLDVDQKTPLHGPVDELLRFAASTSRTYIFCKHYPAAPGGAYYKLRFVHKEHVPARLHELTSGQDVVRLRGLINYDGALTDTVYTTGPSDEPPTEWRYDLNTAVAQLLVGPSADAYLTLARYASHRGEHRTVVEYSEQGFKLLDEDLPLGPWNRLTREFYPLWTLAQSYAQIGRFLDAEKAMIRALQIARVDTHSHYALKQQILRARAMAHRPCRLVSLDDNLADVYTEAPGAALIASSAFEAQEIRRRAPFLRVLVRPQMPRPSKTEVQKTNTVLVLEGDSNAVEIMAEVNRIVPALTRTGVRAPDAKVFLFASGSVPLDAVPLLTAQRDGVIPVVLGSGCYPEYVFRGYYYRPPLTAEVRSLMVKRVAHLLTHEPERYDLELQAREAVDALPDPLDVVLNTCTSF